LSPNIRFYADIVYTNTPPAGAYRGYGVPQGFWPLERHMEMIARDLGLDPLGFRLKNALRSGEYQPFSTPGMRDANRALKLWKLLGWKSAYAKARKLSIGSISMETQSGMRFRVNLT